MEFLPNPNVLWLLLVAVICVLGILRTVILVLYGLPRPLRHQDVGKWYKILSVTDWYEGDTVIVVTIPLHSPKHCCVFQTEQSLLYQQEGQICVVRYNPPSLLSSEGKKIFTFDLVEDQNETN